MGGLRPDERREQLGVGEPPAAEPQTQDPRQHGHQGEDQEAREVLPHQGVAPDRQQDADHRWHPRPYDAQRTGPRRHGA
ncbi:hypothetical protein O1L60_41430 [Streptomyces diastatochromogenes]|nr:hypothetical protein [Streptomyces diastatochromogenes]